MVKERPAILDQSSGLALLVGRFTLHAAKKEQKGGRRSAAQVQTHNFSQESVLEEKEGQQHSTTWEHHDSSSVVGERSVLRAILLILMVGVGGLGGVEVGVGGRRRDHFIVD